VALGRASKSVVVGWPGVEKIDASQAEDTTASTSFGAR